MLRCGRFTAVRTGIQSQIPDGPTLVVGAQASGLQIAEELAASRPVYLSVSKRLPRYVPRRILGRDPFWWFDRTGLVRVPVTTRLGKVMSRRQEPIVGTNARRIVREQAIQIFPRAVDARLDEIVFADGRGVTIRSVVWATGFRSDFSWITVPTFDERGIRS